MMLFAVAAYLVAGVITLCLPASLTKGMRDGQIGLALGYFVLALVFLLLSLFRLS